MSHTLWVILGGLGLLAGIFGVAAAMGRPFRQAGSLFALVWAIAAGITLWVGVMHAGYTLAEELPIFAVVFAVPVLLGWAIARCRR